MARARPLAEVRLTKIRKMSEKYETNQAMHGRSSEGRRPSSPALSLSPDAPTNVGRRRHGATVHPRVLAASVMGGAIEWFDYFLYGALASLVFGKLFFPAHDPAVGLMLSYATFAVTFFIRPLGGVVFSHLGDRVGRKKTLVITLTLMGGGTALIGLLPTYQQVGLLAPALLVLLRLLQGLGIGGEWGGALLLAYEYAPAQRKGLFGSLPQTGVTIGMLLSTLSVSLVSLLPDEAFLRWGWRLPFLASVGLVFVGMWIRSGVDETPEFKAMAQRPADARSPLRQVLQSHWREVLTAIGAKFVETAPFYIFTVFVVGYATGVLKVSRFSALNAVTVGALVATVGIPFCGWLSDRLGRRRVFLTGAVLTALYAPAYFVILGLRTPVAILWATVIGMGLIWPLVTSVLGTLFSEIFSAEVRYTGVTLGYQTGAALVGGTAPLVATWLLHGHAGGWTGVAAYVSVTAAISILAVAFGARRRPA